MSLRLRGKPGASVPTVPDFGEQRPFLPRSAQESGGVSTDGRRFWRSAPRALPTVPDFGAARHPFLPTLPVFRAAIYLLFYLV